MYKINEKTLQLILRRKFSSLVGNCLEEIDGLQEKYNLNAYEIDCFKRLIKKLNYEAMREIEQQISAFSTGVQINVSFIKPTKE